ncbi:unnamed protein product [Parascedosporium putredinis]|uniref:Roadblock/LAMTOR2 domain-containing protein n=1 Tax=Parascedosporium putredinis TaxID=1442378 RepID=A0A9P1GWB0_9PEZI|nr:unnamed protein product [Parascedosporium putredinis]CAI7988190.1 unnamed protein product [Parascedosporium putredinis]
MTDSIGVQTHDALDETLGRLSKKPGVKATIVLDRATGSVLKTSGQVSSLRRSRPTQPAQALASPSRSVFPLDPDSATSASKTEQESDAEEVNAFAALSLSADVSFKQDELKLLRLRTKKQELVIVPDPKYLLIVVHDTPPA